MAEVLKTALTIVNNTSNETDVLTAAKLADIARGSILYGNASAATAELTKGGANTVLTSDGTDISWAAASGGTSLAVVLALS